MAIARRLFWCIMTVLNIHDICVGRDHGWLLATDWFFAIVGLFLISSKEI